MSVFTTRTVLNAAGIAALGAGAIYAGQHYYRTSSPVFTPAHAETLPSNTKADLNKMKWSGFTKLHLESSEMVNHNVKKLTFLLPQESDVTGISPITSLLTKHTPAGSWIPVFRPYTPISANNEVGRVTFLVKQYPNGKGSGKMHSLVPGETMEFKPLHEFDYKPNQFSAITLISGGSGITPIYQLTRAILDNPEDKTKLSLIYGNNSEQDILLRTEFEQLEKAHPDRFRKLLTVSKRTSSASDVEQGYVTKETLQKAMFNKMSEKNVKVLVSGPPAMIEAIAGAKGGFGWTQGSLGGILSELGYVKEEVHKF